MLKVPEFAAEVDVRDAGADVEMEVDSGSVLPAAAAATDSSLHSDSDIDNDDDGTVPSEYSVASSDSEQPREENINADDDRASSVDIYESRTPSPHPADTTLLPDEQTATVAGAGDSVAVPSEVAIVNNPVSGTAVENTAVAQHAVQALDLDNSLTCFRTTKRKKPIIAPPVSKEEDVDEAEVSV